MRLGRIVEAGPRPAIFGDPRHEYTGTRPYPDPSRRRTAALPAGRFPSPSRPVSHAFEGPVYDRVGPDHFVLMN